MEEDIQDAEVLEGEIVTLSSKIDTLLKYPWPKQTQDLIDTLRLSDDLSEAEMYAMLVAQGRKFGIVTESEYNDIPTPRASTEVAERPEFELIPYERTPVKAYNFMEIIETDDFHVEWDMDGLLVQNSLFAFGGDSGIGKTQAMIRLGIALATGGEFLGYRAKCNPKKIVVFSLEMGGNGIKQMLTTMAGDLSDKEKKLVRENFIFLPYATRLSLNEKRDQLEYWRALQEYKPDGIIIDSWSQATTGGLNEDTTARDAMAFVMLIRSYFNCFVGIIHHAKKRQGDTTFTEMDALYGSVFFTTPLDLAVVFYKKQKGSAKLEFNIVKNRYFPLPEKSTSIRRTECLNFMLESVASDPVAMLINSAKPKPISAKKRAEENTKKMNKTLGEMLGLGGDFKFHPNAESVESSGNDESGLEL